MQKYVFGMGTAQVGMTHTRLWTLERPCSMQKYIFGKGTGRHDPYQTLKPRKTVQHAEVHFWSVGTAWV